MGASEYLHCLEKYLRADDINLTKPVRLQPPEADLPSCLSDAIALKHLKRIELLNPRFNISFDLVKNT